jgi:predicted nucleic-acid-binding Zn-ribbon protein
MKKLKFTIIKIPVSQEEKLQRAKDYVEDTGIFVNIQEFVDKEIYDEYVEMRCLQCAYTETVDFDMLSEIMDMEESAYPELHCPKCADETMIPIDIYDIKEH